MLPTQKNIKDLFAADDFRNYYLGQSYRLNREIQDLEITESGPTTEITCKVQGNPVSVRLDSNRVLGRVTPSCTCREFLTSGNCAHVAAALIAATEPDAPPVKHQGFSSPAMSSLSDASARDLLTSYLEKSRNQSVTLPGSGTQRLVPRLSGFTPQSSSPALSGFPALSLAIGSDRLYVIRDIHAFLENVDQGKTASYGRGQDIRHVLSSFDAPSRRLIGLLMDQFRQFRTMGWDSTPESSGWPRNGNRAEIILDGPAFDELFSLLQEFPRVFTLAGSGGETVPMEVVERDPEVHLNLKRVSQGAKLEVNFPGQNSFFATRSFLYAYSSGTLLRCSPAFRESIYPLLEVQQQSFLFGETDLPGLCSCIIPELQNCADLQDPDQILSDFTPDECIPQFYFDLDRSEFTLILKIGFLYGNREISSADRLESPPGIRRNLVTEQNALDFARAFFPEQNANRSAFTLSGDDAIFDFLSSQLDSFSDHGEVYISERLRKKRFVPLPPRVGVSVQKKSLMMSINTGGFPLDELEDLYQSMLRRLRYYRLKDGRFLALDGSPFERLAELVHMLRLSPEDLQSGEIQLPTFRAMYLDNVLSEEGFRFTRDSQFRSLVRNFKSFQDSDYSPPACVEPFLRPYQLQGFQWLKTLESYQFGGILADDMGLGKTLQMISFFASSTRADTGLPSLVVCPASLVLNWIDEFGKFAPDLKVAAIIGPAAERLRLLDTVDTLDVIVTSYELLRQDIDHYEEISFYCCTLDEGQYIKNSATQNSKAVKRIRCSQRFILTGTPIENRLSELWNLFDFLMPGYLFSHRVFVEKLEKPAVQSRDPEAMAQLRKLVQPFMLRRLKREVLKELPPKIELVQRISLSEDERRLYHAAAKKVKESARGHLNTTMEKMQVLAGLTQLRQICCDPNIPFENYTGPTSKLEACLELCSTLVESGHQILLFSQFTTMLDIIRQRLKAMNISSFTLQGSTPKDMRAKLVRDFNNHRASVFLISLKAGGTGLNLTAADVVIHYDPWWNQAAQDQATDRAHRIGQENSVQVYKLIAENTIEERIISLQKEKAALMDAISEGTQQSLLSMTKEDLLALLT